MLRVVSGGAYAEETVASHVGLGSTLLLVTPRRLLYVRRTSWELLWQVECTQLRGATLDAHKAQLSIHLGEPPGGAAAPTRRTLTVDCVTPAAVPLVRQTIAQRIT